MDSRRGRARHSGQGRVHDVGRPRERGCAVQTGEPVHAGDFVSRNAPQNGRCAVAGRVDDDEVAQTFKDIFDEAPRVVSGLDDPVDCGKIVSGITSANRVEGLVEKLTRGVTQKVVRAFPSDGVVVGTRDDLVEQREGVADRAAARTNHQRKNAVFDGDLFLDAEFRHVIEHHRGRNEPKRVVVGARSDCADDLLGFRRRKDELDVLGGFFDDFEESVEALLCDHVRFVKDENLVSVTSGRESCAFAKFAGVIDAIVARRINLDDIERTGTVARQLDTTVAFSTRSIGRPFGAIEATSEDSGGRRFSATSGPRKQVGVIDAILTKSGTQRIGHLRLPDEFIE